MLTAIFPFWVPLWISACFLCAGVRAALIALIPDGIFDVLPVSALLICGPPTALLALVLHWSGA